MSKRKLILRTPKKCPFCGSPRVTKKSKVMDHEMPNGLHNYLYRAICHACHQNYGMREVYQEGDE